MVTREGVRSCSGRVAAHGSSVSQLSLLLTCPHLPALTCSKLWLHHLPGLALPPLFGVSSGRLSSSFRRPASKAKCWRAFTSSITHNLTATNQSLIHHFFFHPRDPSLRLHSLHFARISTTPTLAYPDRTNSAHSNASSARSVSRSPTSHPRPDYQTAPNMADAADEDLFADL